MVYKGQSSFGKPVIELIDTGVCESTGLPINYRHFNYISFLGFIECDSNRKHKSFFTTILFCYNCMLHNVCLWLPINIHDFFIQVLTTTPFSQHSLNLKKKTMSLAIFKLVMSLYDITAFGSLWNGWCHHGQLIYATKIEQYSESNSEGT